MYKRQTRGLAKICKEGTDSIGSALKELERAGYVVCNQLRDNKGKIVDVEYVIYETPHPPDTGQPCEDEPDMACPDTENPDMDNPRLKCTQSQGHNEIPKTRELLCDHRSGQKLFFMHRRFALQRINA